MNGSVVAFEPVDEPVLPESGPIRIHLGCNQHPLPGYINVDVENFAGVDVVADLEKPWPWPDNHADEIYTADLPEHLRGWYETPDPAQMSLAEHAIGRGRIDEAVGYLFNAISKPVRTYGVIHFMNEAHRVLKPGGYLKARIPTTQSKAWAQDPTHVSFWNENTFLYFTHPGYRGLYPHLITAKFEAVKVDTIMPNQYGESWVKAILRKPLA